jgi:hypothetical protein
MLFLQPKVAELCVCCPDFLFGFRWILGSKSESASSRTDITERTLHAFDERTIEAVGFEDESGILCTTQVARNVAWLHAQILMDQLATWSR